jgi:hypothetical protein
MNLRVVFFPVLLLLISGRLSEGSQPHLDVVTRKLYRPRHRNRAISKSCAGTIELAFPVLGLAEHCSFVDGGFEEWTVSPLNRRAQAR